MEVGSNVVLVFIRQAYENGGAWFLELAMKDLAGDQEGLPCSLRMYAWFIAL